MRDIVTRLDPGLVGWRVFGRRNHLNRFVLKRNRQAKPAIFAVDLRLQIAEIRFVQKPAMRIEAGEHALDRAFHQLLVLDLVDIARLDLFVDCQKLFKLTELIGLRLFLLRVLGEQHSGGYAYGKSKSNGRRQQTVFHGQIQLIGS